MGFVRSYARILVLLSILPWCFSTEIVGERSLDISASIAMQLSHGVQVQDSPGKPGKSMACERVHIHGLSRIKYLSKFAHSGTVKVSPRNSTAYVPSAEVCFHRNASLGVGMCSEDQWEKISKGSWVRHMSPFDYKILDIRTASSSLERYEVSIEEDFFMHRVILLVFGIILLSVASFLSKSLVFYYGSAMAVGIILVILVVLFQGMKLVPFGGRRLAFFIPSTIAGFAFLLKQIAPGFLRSILVFVGLDEEMYDPVVKFLLAFIILAGAWMGFWVVRKLFLTEDGSIDTSTSHFVSWSIRILAVLMISQSSVDPVLATEAVVSGIVVSSLLRRIFRLRFLRRVFRKSMKLFKGDRRRASSPPDHDSDFSDEEETFDEFAYGLQSKGDFNTVRRQRRNLTPASISPYHGLGHRTPKTPVVAEDTGLYLSSFHSTPQRRRFSKQGWEKFTVDSTLRGLDELASSPGFGKWLHQNANRISVTPDRAERPQRNWLFNE